MSKQLIQDLGGAKKLAAALETTHGAVRNWQLDGRAVPWKYRPAVARMAAERGIPLPEGFWEVRAA